MKNDLKIFFSNLYFSISFVFALIKNRLVLVANDLFIIFNDYKKVLFFFVCLPIINYIIKIQFMIGFLFLFFFLTNIFITLILKTERVLVCQELPFNSDRLFFYSLYNIFFNIPKSKSFIIVYNTIYILKNSKKNNFSFYLIFITLLFFTIFFLVRFSILIIIGFSYLSVLNSIFFTLLFFDLYYSDYDSNKAKYQHILLNCFILYSNSVSEADEKKIIFTNNNIKLNNKDFILEFLKNTKRPDLFFDNFYNSYNSKTKLVYMNNHFGFFQKSSIIKDINLGTNLSSNKYIYTENKEKILNKHEFNPNLIGQNKSNFFLPFYKFSDKDIIKSSFPFNFIQKANSLKSIVDTHIIESKNDDLLHLKNGSFFFADMTVKDFVREFNIPIYIRIDKLETFEKINENWLKSDRGKEIYEHIKNCYKVGEFSDFYSKNN